MTDKMILRIATEASEALSKMEFWMPCHQFGHTYNRLWEMAVDNHPGTDVDRLGPLKVPKDYSRGNIISPSEMKIHFSVLRMVLEALQTDSDMADK
jgi:hypothetical protein